MESRVIQYSGTPKSLDDIRINPIIMGELKRDLDPKIKDLVKAVNFFGVNTNYSCEGHLDYRRHFPWIDIASSPAAQRRLEKVVADFDSKASDLWQWQVALGSLRTVHEATNEVELDSLQASAERLAKFIFEKTLKGAKRS